MRKQVIEFWRDVIVAFLILAAIVVVGMTTAGCAVKKPKIDGEVFNPIIEHSEITSDCDNDCYQ